MPTMNFSPTGEQQAVIDHRGGHLQVIACAGAGKTEAISRRTVSLIEEGTEPGEIIAFTFTERAAASLKNRITKRVAESKGLAFLDRLSPMFVGTIHAYCFRLLQDFVPELGNHDLLDENQLAGLLSREEKNLELKKIVPEGKHWSSIGEFLRNADIVENELIPSKELGDTPFATSFRKYVETLDRYRYLTFGRLITKAVEALETTEVAKKVRANLRHLIVDEYQDINPAQEKLIRLLAKSPVQLTVVADDDQAIYQWRGSDVKMMQGFSKRYKGTTSLKLSENRRSRPAIIEVANRFAATIQPRLEKAMIPCRKAAAPEVVAWSAETDAREAEIIAESIERLGQAGFRYRDIAILFRSVRTAAPPLLAELDARGIPYRCGGRAGLFQQPEMQALGKLYAWLSDNDWKPQRYSEMQPVDFDDLLAEIRKHFPKAESEKELRAYLESWKAAASTNASPVNLVRDYYVLLYRLGVRTLDLADPLAVNRLGTLARFSQLFADFESVTRRARNVEEQGKSTYRGGQDRGKYFYGRLFNYLQFYALDSYTEFEGEETFATDAVDILTVHQSKGLEWPVVFVPSLVEGRFPSRKSGNEQNWLLTEDVFPEEVRKRYEGSETEERRLFYVAMTRARDTLYLSHFEKKSNKFKPSRFLTQLFGDVKRLETLPVPKKPEAAPHGTDELPVVTFSELAAYETCPLQYRLSSLLGFQSQLATELGYGKAIHHILRHVAEFTQQAGKKPTKKQLEAIFNDHFYLPFANLPLFENLRERANALVHKYIDHHGDDLLRVWQTERPFELHLGGANVTGRADVILDREGGVTNKLALVDYKTANDSKQDDLFAFQLQIYAAAGRGEGLDVVAARVHHLKETRREDVPIDTVRIRTAKARALALVEGIAEGDFPERPGKEKCTRCDVRAVCKHAACGKYDL
ncbi:ATP-dependent helicase [Limnoglobus roseus]|uniref:DNA 3'-5' helicase n=1 Tax=Limnoglobus roseus TaxID=2598579 RepID=A0A5C1AGL0_9BACT|nr:ATP-dependent DNA helicase [Limnoglobus roseus]QEL17383.1 ATP-dependent DNA helicase [Limnoglobus roseus]